MEEMIVELGGAENRCVDAQVVPPAPGKRADDHEPVPAPAKGA